MAGLAVVLGAVTWLVAPLVLPAKLPADFPAAPDLKKVNASMRALIESADKQARRQPESAEKVGRLAMVYHANLFLAQATRAYRIAARQAPGDYRWVYGQASLEEEKGNEEEQQRLLEQAVRLKPDYASALVKLGDARFKHDRLDEASHYYKLAGTSLQAVFGLCRVAARRSKWKDVIECAVPLTRTYPYLQPPYELLAEAYTAIGQPDRAAEARKGMLESKSKVVPPVDDPFSEELTELSYSSTRLLKQAGLLAHLGYPERAIEVARRAAQAEPTDPDIRFFLARTLLASHPENPVIVDESLTQLAECIRLRPDDPAPLWMFAQDFFELPKAGIAVERLRDLVNPYRERTEAHFFLGLLADGRGQTGEAISQYRTALEHEPANAAVYNKLGLALNKAGRLDEAIASFQKSVELNSMNPVARFNLAAAQLQRGNEAQGMKDLVEVLRLKPDYAPAHFCMAFACLYAKKPNEAITHFREGLRQMPNDPEAHFGLASVLSMQRKPQDAIVELREALMLRPNYPEATDLLRRLER